MWKAEEEHALRLGVANYGTGAWEIIRTDKELHKALCVSSAQ